jgi:hypothetical protein
VSPAKEAAVKRSTLVLGIVLLIVGGTLVALLDPLGTREDPAAGRASPEPSPAAGVEAGRDEQLVAPSSGTTDAVPRERLAVDPELGEKRALLHLLDAEGRAVPDAFVAVARGDELLHAGSTDQQGELALVADRDPAQVIARAPGRPLDQWQVRLDPGLHELRYRGRARLSGRLFREDGTPAGGLQVRLYADEPMLPEEPIPEFAWKYLGIPRSGDVRLLTESLQDGSFVVTGLPPDWRGTLRLPRGWLIDSSSHGVVEPRTRTLRVELPVDDLLLRLSAPAILRGRLLSRGDATPLTGAMLSARLEAPDPEPADTVGIRTDDEGRFVLTARGPRIVGLELRLGNDPHEGPLLLALGVAGLPPDGELGDVYVENVRDIPFLLLESGGAPIPGGTARAAGSRSDPTGDDGRGVLRWLPLDVQRLRAEAPDFVPVEVELTPLLPDPLAIVLEPASRLEVGVVPPAGGDPGQFRVVLHREEGVVAGPLRDQADQASYVGAWTFPPVDMMQAPRDTYLASRVSAPEGIAEFRALQVGVPIELEVRGITGSAVYHRRTLEPLRAGERRRVEVALGEEVVVFRGRILDAAGAPLERATVQLGGQILGWTDADGAFLCFLADAEPGTLVLQHTDCSTLFLHDYVVPPGGREAEFRLQPAREVTIEVVDEAGQPVPEAEVWILQEGFTTNTNRVEGSRHLASSLTDQPFEIEVQVGGHRYIQEHTSDVPEARVVVPVHGSVLARVSAATTDGRAGSVTLILQPLEAESGDPIIAFRRCQPGGLTLELSAVLPGRYEAWLSYEPTENERAAGRVTETSAAIEVTIEAARRADVALDLP